MKTMRWIIRNKGLRVHEKLLSFSLFGWEVWYIARVVDTAYAPDAAVYEVGIYAIKGREEKWIIKPEWLR